MATPSLQQGKESAAGSARRVWSPAGFRTPGSSPGGGLSDEAIWKRLKEAGFDEEMIRKRDKAALVAYITKLEAQIYDYQHNMGLLILEQKDLISKYEQIKASADSAELAYKGKQAAQSSALAEWRKREDNLRRSLAIEKECISSLEKTLHSIRVESSERKVAAENKLAEAYKTFENAQKTIEEAHNKSREADSLRAEASRYQRTAAINLQQVEAREDELRRRFVLFNSQCDAKEKSISMDRQSVYESQKMLQREQEKLLERQASLHQREEHILERLQELHETEKQLEITRENLDKDWASLREEKSNMTLDIRALATKEKSIIERETLLEKKEFLVFQGKLAAKEHDEIQRLKIENLHTLDQRKIEFEAELEELRQLVDDELERKRQNCKQREIDLQRRIKSVEEKENAIQIESRVMFEKNDDLRKKLKQLEEKEQSLSAAGEAAENKCLQMQMQKKEIENMRLDMEKSEVSLEAEKHEVQCIKDKLEITIAERNDLFVMEKRLKEEIDSFRAQQAEVAVMADKLREEKENFEHDWELIDEKRAELHRAAEKLAAEKESVRQYLKHEQVNLKIEKENLHNQFIADLDALSQEQEEFIREMRVEHSSWLRKIQKERADVVEDMRLQKRELENSIKKRHDEIEAYLREREETFEREKKRELQYIEFQKEKLVMDSNNVALEIKKIHDDKTKIALDRVQREKEWSEIKDFIDELNMQREKLQKQRELLHADREEIYAQIQHLKKLEHLSLALEHRSLHDDANVFPTQRVLGVPTEAHNACIIHEQKKINEDDNIKGGILPYKTVNCASPPRSMNFSWVRKCAEFILRPSPDKLVRASSGKDGGKNFVVQYEAISNPMETNEDGKNGAQPVDMRCEENAQCSGEGLYSLPREGKKLKRSAFNVDQDVHLDSSHDQMRKDKRYKLEEDVARGEVTLESQILFDGSPSDAISEPCFKEVHESFHHPREVDN